MLTVLAVVGTRPEAIKMAPVITELRKRSDCVTCYVCATAQHRQMLDQALGLFELKPDYDLNIMQNGQSLSYVTASVLTGLEAVIQEVKPHWMLIQGDTTTTMSASLAAVYHRVRIGHIEAGLRTWDKFHPYPEEINRRIADALSDLHFAPTEQAKKNLLREGIPEASIAVTGNTVIDALLDVASRPFQFQGSPLLEVPWENRRIILLTAHRRENFGRPLLEICAAVQYIAQRYASDVYVVYPVHLNPQVQEPVRSFLNGLPNVLLTGPLDYLAFVHLMKRSFLILTDSGGLQEEGPSLGKPVLVMREATERPEAVEAGTARVVGIEREGIIEGTMRLLENESEYRRMARAINPYGDGKASQRIVQRILKASQIVSTADLKVPNATDT
jgi:UDP-N-acetylglucosamine 2-epimerase (non-hydrolysing)